MTSQGLKCSHHRLKRVEIPGKQKFIMCERFIWKVTAVELSQKTVNFYMAFVDDNATVLVLCVPKIMLSD